MKRRLGITHGELAWMFRRRTGLTTTAMAHKLGLTEWFLYRIEHDEAEPTLISPVHWATFTRDLTGESLTAGEFSALCRRRMRMPMRALAEITGVSRMTVWNQEHDRTATAGVLARWWLQQFAQIVPAPRTRCVMQLALRPERWP